MSCCISAARVNPAGTAGRSRCRSDSRETAWTHGGSILGLRHELARCHWQRRPLPRRWEASPTHLATRNGPGAYYSAPLEVRRPPRRTAPRPPSTRSPLTSRYGHLPPHFHLSPVGVRFPPAGPETAAGAQLEVRQKRLRCQSPQDAPSLLLVTEGRSPRPPLLLLPTAWLWCAWQGPLLRQTAPHTGAIGTGFCEAQGVL